MSAEMDTLRLINNYREQIHARKLKAKEQGTYPVKKFFSHRLMIVLTGVMSCWFHPADCTPEGGHCPVSWPVVRECYVTIEDIGVLSRSVL